MILAIFETLTLKPIRYIYKSVAIFILMTMVQTFYCSVMCAFSPESCCDEAMGEEQSCINVLCNDEHEGEENNNCQENHLAFFKTIGKYSVSKTVSSFQLFATLKVQDFPPMKIIQPEGNVFLSAKTINHIRPPVEEVVVLNHTFRI